MHHNATLPFVLYAVSQSIFSFFKSSTTLIPSLFFFFIESSVTILHEFDRHEIDAVAQGFA